MEKRKNDGLGCDLSRYLCDFLSVPAMTKVGMDAAWAEENKRMKYSSLDSCCMFTSIAIETIGVISINSMTILCEVGC